MGEALDGLRSELRDLIVARHDFPIWTEWGVDDESLAMHSIGLTYLVTVGQRLGYVAVADYPVAHHEIRADAVWWRRESREPVAYFEFERHKDGNELRAKVRNLMKAWHLADQKPELLVLVFWAKRYFPVVASTISELWSDVDRGYADSDRRSFPPLPAGVLRIFECLHTNRGDKLVLKRFVEQVRS